MAVNYYKLVEVKPTCYDCGAEDRFLTEQPEYYFEDVDYQCEQCARAEEQYPWSFDYREERWPDA